MTPAAPPAKLPPDGLMRLAALIVVVFGLRACGSWLLPICFALLFAVLGSVPLAWLQRRGLPRPLAAAATMAALIAGLWLLAEGLLVSLAEFGSALPAHEQRMHELLSRAAEFLHAVGIEVTTRDMLASIEPRSWLGLLQQSVGGALGLASALLLVVFAVVFLLWENERLRQRLRHALGASWDEAPLVAMVADLQRYLLVKTGTSALTGGLIYLLCVAFGVGFPGLWALLAFVLNFVPIVGSIVAAVPAVFLALVDPALGLGSATGLAIGYVAINNGVSNGLEPVLMGRNIGLPAFTVLLSVVFWGWLWGVGGMFLAVPLTVAVGTVLAGRGDLPVLRALVGRDPH